MRRFNRKRGDIETEERRCIKRQELRENKICNSIWNMYFGLYDVLGHHSSGGLQKFGPFEARVETELKRG
jgi:hypothetical protein